jgi:myo-inositol-1(or 4)-monophosphatase
MDLAREREVLATAVHEAGQTIYELRQAGDFKTRMKGFNDPVTSADLAADRILKEHLLTAFPEDGWLSEETVDDPLRLQKSRVWVIDPIDGTRMYIKGEPEYVVSAALVEEGVSVLGAIYNPSTDEFVLASKGQGATCNGESIRAEREMGKRLYMVTGRGGLGFLKRQYLEPGRFRRVGSAAYQMALVALGETDGILTRRMKFEWDIAAGVVIIQEAGGCVSDLEHRPFRFNLPDPAKHEGLMASTRQAYESICQLAK